MAKLKYKITPDQLDDYPRDPKTGEKISKLTFRDIIKIFEDVEKGVSKSYIAEQLKVERQTIYNILKRYEKPEIIKPEEEEEKRVRDISETKWFKELMMKQRDYWQKKDPSKGKLTSHGARIYLTAKQGFEMLNKKDPINWEDEDFERLWYAQPFCDEDGKIKFHKAVALRRIMSMIGKERLLSKYSTKGLKKVGEKKPWFLNDTEVIAIMKHIKEPDTLMLYSLGIQTGARISSLISVKSDDVSEDLGIVKMVEPKLERIGKHKIDRDVHREFLKLLNQYIVDYNLQGKRIFPYDDKVYRERLVKAGKALQEEFLALGIKFDKKTTPHILKHTFVSLASLHTVSLEVVSEITGTDPSTLKEFYHGVGKEKVRYELLGEESPYKPWHLFLKEDLLPKIKYYYDELKKKVKAV